MTTDKHKPTKPTPVSLHPDSFADDGLLDMSLEQVFALYHKRNQETRKEDKIKPIYIHCRQVVKGVIFCIRFLAHQHKVSESEFMLSISFKVLAELQGIGAVGKLSRSYSQILQDCVQEALFDELSVAASGYNITFRGNHSQGWFPVYPEVQSALQDAASGCGTTVSRLYQVGLAAALSKSDEAVDDGVLCKASNKIFTLELESFTHYMELWQSRLDGRLFGQVKPKG